MAGVTRTVMSGGGNKGLSSKLKSHEGKETEKTGMARKQKRRVRQGNEKRWWNERKVVIATI